MLEIKNINFSYGKRRILNDITFSCSRGEVVGILGPNGSGKTTLIKNILGIEKIKDGIVKLDGKNILELELSEKAKKISYVPQMLNENFNINVMELILSGLKPYINWKITDEQLEKAFSLVRELGLEEFVEKKFNDLSGGQKQKVLIVKAILQETDICILDEPISFLDIGNSIEILKIIKKTAREERKIILIIIHDLDMARFFSDKILLMEKGNVFSYGEAKEVLTCKNIKEIYRVDMTIIDEHIVPKWD